MVSGIPNTTSLSIVQEQLLLSRSSSHEPAPHEIIETEMALRRLYVAMVVVIIDQLVVVGDRDMLTQVQIGGLKQSPGLGGYRLSVPTTFLPQQRSFSSALRLPLKDGLKHP